MATANSCSGTKKTEDMSTEEVCNWIKTNFDDTIVVKVACLAGTREFVWNELFIRNPRWRPSEFLGQRPLATRNGFD